MTLKRKLLFGYRKFLYYFMFRKYKNCKDFCPRCNHFDSCVEEISTIYKFLNSEKRL